MSFLDALFGRKHPPMIGLDISSSSVKLVELSQSATGEYILERFASEPFEKGWIADGQIEKFDEVAEAVRKVVAKSGTKTKQVAMAMPQSAVITKKIMLPAGLREEEMELQVESEANQYIPFALDEVNLDFQVIGPAPSSPEEMQVLIAASRKEKGESEAKQIVAQLKKGGSFAKLAQQHSIDAGSKERGGDLDWDEFVAPWKAKRPEHVYQPVGCLECRNTGYMGRVGLYEILLMSPAIKALVHASADVARIREQGYKEGMKPLRISGALKIAAGLTTIDEVMKVAPPAHDRRQSTR